jgi:hypothetical protein
MAFALASASHDPNNQPCRVLGYESGSQLSLQEAGIMNARFAAVALSSCLSAVLASQLFPLPSLMSLVEANKRSGTPIANGNGSSVDTMAKLAQAPQTISTPQTIDAPEAVNAPQVVDVLQASEAAEPVDAPRTAERPPAADAPQVAAAEINETPQVSATPPVAANNIALSSADAATPAAEPASPATSGTVATADTPQASDKREATFEVASADPTEMLPAAQPTPASAEQLPPSAPLAPVNSVEVFDECFVVDICVDRYLWALYQRTPKEDKVKVSEQRAVTVKRKRKMVTVMKTFAKLVDENFAWKDEAASNKVRMAMEDYVIGGMDRGFKLKLFHVLYAAEEAGLSPGITSAFRDDYRQAIASGLKAASNRSYHGGSLRGGYGHGLAADIVSVKGTTRMERWAATEVLWKWVDAHGKEFGIGRPYLSYDPPHVGPVDGQEYVSRRGGDKVQQAYAEMKKPRHLAARHERSPAKRAKSAATSKASAMRSARNTPARANAG